MVASSNLARVESFQFFSLQGGRPIGAHTHDVPRAERAWVAAWEAEYGGAAATGATYVSHSAPWCRDTERNSVATKSSTDSQSNWQYAPKITAYSLTYQSALTTTFVLQPVVQLEYIRTQRLKILGKIDEQKDPSTASSSHTRTDKPERALIKILVGNKVNFE
jgi:hypothetical protein